MATPVTTSADSPNTLPATGYTFDQLCEYLVRKLGGSIFAVELDKQQLLDACADALQTYSVWRPRIRFGTVALQAGRFDYLRGVDLGTGPVQVNFVQRSPIPQALFWANLIDVAPLMMNGMSEYDMYLRWQQTWMRVTSVLPQWNYDEIEKVLMVHNPIERFQCGVVAYVPYDDVRNLDFFGADWVKNYAFQQARHSLAEILGKYSGMVPGPVKDLQLDQGKRASAAEEIQKLKDKLQAAQLSTPCSTD